MCPGSGVSHEMVTDRAATFERRRLVAAAGTSGQNNNEKYTIKL